MRSFQSCYIPGAATPRSELVKAVRESKAKATPDYATGDRVTWDLGLGRQHGVVEAMYPNCTVVRQGGPNGHLVRLAPDRPRKA
jgi:hypothetical protein